MNTFEIKGQCEHCGFFFQGKVGSPTESLPRIECPSCKKETENFDEAEAIEAEDKVNGVYPYNGYQASEFTIITD